MTHPIVACARSYIGTRFHHQGRLGKTGKHKGGIDCLGLLVCVARDLDLRGKNNEPLADFDARDYPHQPDTKALRQQLETLLYPLPLTDIAPADIALFNIDGLPQHMGIISDIGIIHAYAPARAVVEHAFDACWQQQLVAAFRLPTLNH